METEKLRTIRRVRKWQHWKESHYYVIKKLTYFMNDVQ